MMSSILASRSGVVARQVTKATGLRTMAVTPRSANTPDSDKEDDNLLPVSLCNSILPLSNGFLLSLVFCVIVGSLVQPSHLCSFNL